MFSTAKPVLHLSLPHSPALLTLTPALHWGFPSPDAPSSLHFLPPLLWAAGGWGMPVLCWCEQLCALQVSWHWALLSWLLLKEFLLSGLLKIFTVLGIFEFLILCQSWSSADELKRCVGGKMAQCVHVNLVFIQSQAIKRVQSTWMCENKQVTLCTWLV